MQDQGQFLVLCVLLCFPISKRAGHRFHPEILIKDAVCVSVYIRQASDVSEAGPYSINMSCTCLALYENTKEEN